MNYPRVKKFSKKLLCATFATYLLWVIIPYDKSIRVYNHADLPQEDINAIIEHARSRGVFAPERINQFTDRSRWIPFCRGYFFIDVRGSKTHVGVRSGFIGGPLYGGGRCFDGDKSSGIWVFTDDGFWVS